MQQLGRKAFPSIVGKDFDRLLKGQFYQALQVRWQRKLGAPKPDESFHDLLVQARMLEEQEKQFSASRTRKSGRKSGSVDPRRSRRRLNRTVLGRILRKVLTPLSRRNDVVISARGLVTYVETAL